MSKNWYPIIDYEKCTVCGACQKKCSHGVFEDKGGMMVVVKPVGCVEGCHGCQRLCAAGAISYYGEKDSRTKPSGCGCDFK